jgi:hypothetical protein
MKEKGKQKDIRILFDGNWSSWVQVRGWRTMGSTFLPMYEEMRQRLLRQAGMLGGPHDLSSRKGFSKR